MAIGMPRFLNFSAGMEKSLFSGTACFRQAEQPREHLVKAVTDLGIGEAAFVAVGHEGECQHLVRAVAHKYVFRRQAVGVGNGFAQRFCQRIGVKVQSRDDLFVQCLHHTRGGRERAFVGVELYVLLIPRLLTGHIGREGLQAVH